MLVKSGYDPQDANRSESETCSEHQSKISCGCYLESRDPISGTVYYAELGYLPSSRTSSTAEEIRDFGKGTLRMSP
jgi:hypothetical protein